MAKKASSKTDITNSKRIQAHISEGEKIHHFFSGIGKKTDNIRKEFIEFINRGSVIDLAIGVAVGGAFNTIVNSFVNDIVMPIVGLIAGGVDFNNLAIRIPNFFGADDAATISYGKFLQACLQFLIIAWVFFLIVKTMNGIHRKHESDVEKINKAIEKSEEEIAAKLDSKAKKDSQSKGKQSRAKTESKIESALKADAAARETARKKRAATAAQKAQSSSSNSSSSSKTSSSSKKTTSISSISNPFIDAFTKKK